MQQSLFDEEVLGEKVPTNDYLEFCQALGAENLLTPDEFGHRLRQTMGGLIPKPIRTLALFSGAGGLDIGFSDAGFDIIETAEIEAKFVKTLLHNQAQGTYLRHAQVKCVDVRAYFPTFAEGIDFIIGGPPCQSFSAAGRRAAGVAGTKDVRGGLFEEYVRLLDQLKPKGFLFENVYGLVGAEKGEAIRKISLAFREVGYNIAYRVLDAADYGVPQHRERLIIVGVREGLRFAFPKPTHGPDAGHVPHFTASEAVAGAFDSTERRPSINGRFGHLLPDVPPGLNYSFYTEKMGHAEPLFAWRSKFSDFLYKADPATPIRTLKASGGQYTGPFHWDGRHFTMGELKRLQTFPDDYHIVGNRALVAKQIGNSVPPQFARMLALGVLEQVFGVRLPFRLQYLTEGEPLTFRTRKSSKTAAYKTKALDAKPTSEALPRAAVEPRHYSASITAKHKLVLNAARGEFDVSFVPTGQQWQFAIGRTAADPSAEMAFSVVVSKADRAALFADVKSVLLSSSTLDIKAHTVLWKAFERELAAHKMKADLVQLNGYYQYPSNLVFAFELGAGQVDEPELWQTVANIYDDRANNVIRPAHRLARAYDLPEQALTQAFLTLREAGYEIRNSNTNPEIEEGCYLVPYKFPTLSPLSVQLKRNL